MSSAIVTTGWADVFHTLAKYLQTFAAQQWPLLEDGSGPEAYVSLHRLYSAFPVAVDILLFDPENIDSPRKRDRYATAIRYDFSKCNNTEMRFHGVIPLAKVDEHAPKIKELLGLERQSLEPLRDLSLVFLRKPPFCTHIVPYDPRTRILEYCGDLARDLSFSPELRQLFSPQIDYNEKYNLKPEYPLTEEQLLQQDEINRNFVKLSDLQPETLSERHASVATIQLIPQVPESLRRTFRCAKRLYVYGHLEYDFFTVSLHYAHLALDAALHARWSATLPASVLLTLNKKKKVVKQETMPSPSHVKINRFCKYHGWNPGSAHVNGQPFPYTVNMVIAELTAKGLLSKWQQKMIQEVDVQIRNSLTHLEFAPIHGPSPEALEMAAETINSLFDSVPIPPHASIP
jgi:hypothetical protein